MAGWKRQNTYGRPRERDIVMVELSPSVITAMVMVVMSGTIYQYWVAPPMATDRDSPPSPSLSPPPPPPSSSPQADQAYTSLSDAELEALAVEDLSLIHI